MTEPSLGKKPHQETEKRQHRKIKLPDYCCVGTGYSIGGNEKCDHDYPPESKVEGVSVVFWKCSICGMKRIYEVYD